MLIPSYPNFEYPTGDYTNGDILYNSLGSFWTKIFSDKHILKGLAYGQSEELFQKYYNLLEAVNAVSASKTDIFHKEKWTPIRIKKSVFNQVNLQVGSQYYSGIQPGSSFFHNSTFKVGESMANNLRLFRTPYDTDIKTIFTIVDRVVSPSLVLVNGIDFELQDGFIYFNKDIFDLSYIPKLSIPSFDAEGNETSVDEELLLWSCHTEIDTNLLYTNLGYLFDFKLENTAQYKSILLNTINLLTGGPSVKSLISLGCAFIGVQPVIEDTEVVEDAYYVDGVNYVVTDKHVYSAPFIDPLSGSGASPVIGNIVHSGDLFFDFVEYFDNVKTPKWWEYVFPVSPATGNILGLALPNYLFCADSENSYFFRNINTATVSCAYDSDALQYKITFPVEGNVADVKAFHDYINAPSRVAANMAALGLSADTLTRSDLNPLRFVFENFLQYNAVYVKMKFQTLEQARLFTAYYSIIKKMLPPHVYITFQIKFNLGTEEYNSLNGKSVVYLKTTTTVALEPSSFIENAVTKYYDSVLKISHGLVDGDICYISSTGTLPKGLKAQTLYKIRVVDLDNFELTVFDSGASIPCEDQGSNGATITLTKLTPSWTGTDSAVHVIDNIDGSDSNGSIPNTAADDFKLGTTQRLF